MPNNNETTTKFKVDISELKKNFQEAQRQIRLANSEFKAATSGMDKWSDSADGIGAKLKQLNAVLDAENKKLKSLEEQYKRVVEEQGETSVGADELRIKINNQKAEIGKTEAQIKKYNEKLNNLESGSEEAKGATDDLKNSVKKAGDGFTVAKGVLADLVSKGITAAVDGFKKLATEAVNAYKEVDKGSDNVIKATGATGKQAEDLQRSYKKVAKSIKGDFGNIGNVLGEVNTRFGFTGDKLEETTKDFLKFADITGTDAKSAVANVSKALKAAGLQNKDYAILLDQMTKAAQVSGVSVDALADKITKNGSTFRALGFSVEDTIAMLAQFEAAGVNTDAAIVGLSTSVKNWGSEGKNAKEEFDKAMAAIAAAPTDTEKAKIAFDTFGKKAGTELADAITTGRTNYTDFVNTLKNSEGTVKTTYENTQDGFDQVDLAIQRIKTDMGAFVGELVDQYGPTIKQGFGMIGDAIKGAMTFIFDFTASLGETLGDVYLWCEKVVGRIGDFFKNAWNGLKNFVSNATKSIYETQMDWFTSDEARKEIEKKQGKISDKDWEAFKNSFRGGSGHFAKGGIVRRETQAIIGEDGAEAVIPLEKNTKWLDEIANRLYNKMSLPNQISSTMPTTSNVTNNFYQTNNSPKPLSRLEIYRQSKNLLRMKG